MRFKDYLSVLILLFGGTALICDALWNLFYYVETGKAIDILIAIVLIGAIIWAFNHERNSGKHYD